MAYKPDILTTKGDLLAHDGTQEIRLGVGSGSNMMLVTDSTEDPGMKWVYVASMSFQGDTIEIGVPTDGTYTDGFFDFTSSTKVSDAIDDISEAFLDLAPSQAELLTGEDLVNQNSVFSGKLSSGLNSEWYIGYSAGDTVSVLTSNSSIDLRTPSTTDTFRAGLKRDYTPVNNLTGGVTASKVWGTSGSLSIRAYTSDTGSTGILNLNDLSIYNTFWMKANARIDETVSETGSLVYNISASNAGVTNDYQLFYVGDSTDFPTQSFSVAPSSSIDTEITMYLSGIQYYTSGSTLEVSYTAIDLYNPVYVTGNQSYLSSTYFSDVGINFGGTPSAESTLTIESQSITILSDQSSNYNNLGTGSVTLYKPNKSNVSSNFNIGSRPINSKGNMSTDTLEYFYDENYRNVDESTDGWEPTASLVDGNLQVQNGRLINGEFGDYISFTATEHEYHRKLIPQNSNGNGNITIDRNGFTDFVEEYNDSSSELQIIFRANSKIYDLGRAVGDDDVGSSIYGIRDSITDETITWGLPVGDTVDNANPFKMEIIFRNSTSSDYINSISMSFSQG